MDKVRTVTDPRLLRQADMATSDSMATGVERGHTMVRMNRLPMLLLVTCLLTAALDAKALDPSGAEQEIAARLAERLPAAEVIRLGHRKTPFLGLLREAQNNNRGAVLLLHSMAGHPDWPDVIAPLRTSLPQSGWATLSIQLPVLAPEQPLSDYGMTLQEAGKRIEYAIRYLQSAGFQKIVLIGYSFGATVASSYLAAAPPAGVDAFVAISLLSQDFLSPRPAIPEYIEAIHIPILDIYGSRDFTEVLQQVDSRRLAGRKDSTRSYEQVEISEARHTFNGQEALLASRISTWLDAVLPEGEPAASLPGDRLP